MNRMITVLLVAFSFTAAHGASLKRKPAQDCRAPVEAVTRATLEAIGAASGVAKADIYLKLTRNQGSAVENDRNVTSYSVVGAVGGFDYLTRLTIDDRCVVLRMSSEKNGKL